MHFARARLRVAGVMHCLKTLAGDQAGGGHWISAPLLELIGLRPVRSGSGRESILLRLAILRI